MQRLRNDHDAIRRICREYGLLLAGTYDEARTAIPGQRVIVSQLFRRHIADETAMIANGIPDTPIAEQATANLRALYLDYSAHIAEWTPSHIGTDWNGYRAAVTALQRVLDAGMAWEERVLHPLLARSVITAGARPLSSDPSSRSPRDTIAANWRASAPSDSRWGIPAIATVFRGVATR